MVLLHQQPQRPEMSLLVLTFEPSLPLPFPVEPITGAAGERADARPAFRPVLPFLLLSGRPMSPKRSGSDAEVTILSLFLKFIF